jgi:hypothetical protein
MGGGILLSCPLALFDLEQVSEGPDKANEVPVEKQPRQAIWQHRAVCRISPQQVQQSEYRTGKQA